MRFENLYFVKNFLDLKYRLGPHAFLIVKELIAASKNGNFNPQVSLKKYNPINATIP